MASKSTVVVKKKGARGGVNPGTAGTGAGLLPYGAQTGGQSSADPVKSVKATQDKNRRAIGYGQR
ncbi:hypothetical protein SEA_DAKITI_17 [Gordonia phage Dakiti]|uniref:Uncharacterized protein n=1 Tax=Gordonia phage Chelms TaxID=2588132 RepID=A0A4Y6EID4_9CAUD|nr:head-tail connector protein [Gordonia phage Chelms]QDF18232.1 hypothetical protein SEA_CHELMS_17 [Gordonia phage Chelms]QOR56163.1 hypothetical protein SEA_LINETTI_18 [Gordonia phage Linetti]WIC40005.1 hypothetical protein SEA_DAKITI_17 [Gordonia phage Dakiti]